MPAEEAAGRKQRPSSISLWSSLYDDLAQDGNEGGQRDVAEIKPRMSLFGDDAGGARDDDVSAAAAHETSLEPGVGPRSTSAATEPHEVRARPVISNAALRFTPTVRKAAPKTKQVTAVTNALSSDLQSFSGPAPGPLLQTTETPSLGARNVETPRPPMPAIEIIAPPRLVASVNEAAPTSTSNDDVNGFLASHAGQSSKKRKTKKRKGNGPGNLERVSWEEEYNPLRPNDYEEWKAHVRRKREAVRNEYLKQMDARQDDRKEREQSVYSEDEGDMDVHVPGPVRALAERAPEIPLVAVDVEESGDAAYARRLAMSQSEPQSVEMRPVSTPEVVPSDPDAERARRIEAGKAAAAALAAKYTHSSADQSPAQSGNRMSTAELSALARHAGIQYLSSKSKSQIEDDLAEAHAEEISASSDRKPDPRKFAERLMQKYGWTKGSGLGKDEAGIKHALTIEKVKPDSKGDKAGESAGRSRPVIAQVRNKEAERQQKEEEAKYGTPSRVVLMTNVISAAEALEDEDLAQEIGEECARMGPIERCFIHVVPAHTFAIHDLEEPLDPVVDGVRVFVLYTGLVGAWKACREFNGRWFGGREMKCRFWDEELFRRGRYVK